MLIIPNQLFKHGYDTYEPGEEYELPEGLATYFVLNGWASAEGLELSAEPQPDSITLDVQDAMSAHQGQEAG